MGTTYMDFGTGVFHVDGDAPLTQSQVDSVWRHLPTTGASWVERGQLFVQQSDGATAFNLGTVARGVKGVSDKVRLGGHTRQHATMKSKGTYVVKSFRDRALSEEMPTLALAKGTARDLARMPLRWKKEEVFDAGGEGSPLRTTYYSDGDFYIELRA
jgi:hypothetical protein